MVIRVRCVVDGGPAHVVAVLKRASVAVKLVAEDEDTAAYVRDLETEWDEADDDDLEDDPELLVAEVEEFLRDVD